MVCIFCRGSVAGERVEHILPESLGGKDWACLPPGLVCDRCNQYFGSKVEQPALGSFPFLQFRALLGILTKHGRQPALETMLGTLRPAGEGAFAVDPGSEFIRTAMNKGEVRRVRIPAEPTAPVEICRLLLKMGLELVADASPEEALSARFDSARRFARHPKRGDKWWFLLSVDYHHLFDIITRGLQEADEVSLSVVTVERIDAFHLQFFCTELIAPLDAGVEPAPELGQDDRQWRLFRVRV